VSNGQYTVQIDNVAQSGVVTSVSQTAIVNRSLANVTANVYNGAGELVRTLYYMLSNPVGSNMTNVSLSSDVFKPNLSSSNSNGIATTETIYVQNSTGTAVTLTWDGTNNSGSVVTPGQYSSEVHWNNGNGSTEDITREILVEPNAGVNGIVVAKPNILNPTNGMATIIDASGVSNAASVKVKVYTISGELVANLLPGTIKANWSASGFASGIYIANVEIDNAGGGIMNEQRLKILVLH
jgi:flagellar hook assembly protein FlgD